MTFRQIDHIVSTCRFHLDQTGSRGSLIENYLVRYLLVAICAEYESRLRSLLEIRASKAGDPHVQALVKSQTAQLIRGVKKTPEIRKILNGLDSSCGASFDAELNKSTASSSYDSIVSNRHNVAHQAGPTLTFGDLERFYIESQEIFKAVATALGLKTADTSGLT